MTPSLREQFERLALRLAELDATLADPQVASDLQRYRSLLREQAEVRSIVDDFHRYQQRERDLASAQAMLGDAEMAELA